MTLQSKLRQAERTVFARGPMTLSATQAGQVAKWFGEAAQRIEDLEAEAARLARRCADAEATVFAGYHFSLIVAPVGCKGPPIPKAMHREAREFQKIAAYNMSRHSPDDAIVGRAETVEALQEFLKSPPVL